MIPEGVLLVTSEASFRLAIQLIDVDRITVIPKRILLPFGLHTFEPFFIIFLDLPDPLRLRQFV